MWCRLTDQRGAWAAELTLPGARDATSRALLAVDHAPSSQFAALQAALREGVPLPPDLACLALEGSGFRGQRGRSWQAHRGNLHVCRLARLDLPAGSVQAALTALPAVAAARAIEVATHGRVSPGIKWVNDLMLGGRKIGGVLSATQLHGALATYVLTGVGINVAHTPELVRHPSAPPAGSLTELASADAPTLATLTLALLVELDAGVAQLRAGHGAELVEAYRRRSIVIGRQVAVWPVSEALGIEEPLATGRVIALRNDLALDVEGWGRPVHAGRLTLLEGSDVSADGGENGEDG